MSEAGRRTFLEEFRRFLDGDEHHPGLTPWDFEAGVDSPPGFELHYHPETQTLLVQDLKRGSRMRFSWDGFRWREEERATPLTPESEEVGEALWEVSEVLYSLERRIKRIEELLTELLQRCP